MEPAPQTRADELNAISDALAILDDGAAGQYSATKKLNIAQKSAVFLQPRGTNNEALQLAAVVRAQSKLVQVAKSLHDPVLPVTAMKVKFLADQFVKARAGIKDLIATLDEDVDSEATQKSFCWPPSAR